MKTVEELMRLRYKVIADFPGCSYEVDTVLYVDQSGELYSPTAGYSRTVTKVMQCDAEKYPAYIQPLPWWSDREVSDMPEYVRITGVGCTIEKDGFAKVFGAGFFEDNGRNLAVFIDC
jgi:hypothetical protein